MYNNFPPKCRFSFKNHTSYNIECMVIPSQLTSFLSSANSLPFVLKFCLNTWRSLEAHLTDPKIGQDTISSVNGQLTFASFQFNSALLHYLRSGSHTSGLQAVWCISGRAAILQHPDNKTRWTIFSDSFPIINIVCSVKPHYLGISRKTNKKFETKRIWDGQQERKSTLSKN